MKFQVWYQKPDFFRDGIMGAQWLREQGKMPSLTTYQATHRHVIDVEVDEKVHSIEGARSKVFFKMQAENWSPRGEAAPLIRGLCLAHTSMSVGDIMLVDAGHLARIHRAWIVDRCGFVELG
jgi:hypothetical protein